MGGLHEQQQSLGDVLLRALIRRAYSRGPRNETLSIDVSGPSVSDLTTHVRPRLPSPLVCCHLLKHSDLFTPSQQSGLCLMKSVHIYDRYMHILYTYREKSIDRVYTVRGQKKKKKDNDILFLGGYFSNCVKVGEVS